MKPTSALYRDRAADMVTLLSTINAVFGPVRARKDHSLISDPTSLADADWRRAIDEGANIDENVVLDRQVAGLANEHLLRNLDIPTDFSPKKPEQYRAPTRRK